MLKLLKILFVSVLILSLSSCSSTQTRTTTEVSTTDSNGDYNRETTTTNQESTEHHSCGGVLSCSVDFLGEVIAFPFRLVGSSVTAIF